MYVVCTSNISRFVCDAADIDTFALVCKYAGVRKAYISRDEVLTVMKHIHVHCSTYMLYTGNFLP